MSSPSRNRLPDGGGGHRRAAPSLAAERLLLAIPAATLLVTLAVGPWRPLAARLLGPAAAAWAAAPDDAPGGVPREQVLRVCADPNNLPFSNDRGEGFENRIAALLARETGARLEYTWWAQRRGFLRNTLNAGACDVVMGIVAGADEVRTTRPYYRSIYVFVQRPGAHVVRSLDDPALRRLRVGLHYVGDDQAATPPAHALAARGIVGNVTGYPLQGDYRRPNPPAAVVDAVARREIDVAIVWGPLGGYFAMRSRVRLEVVPLPESESGGLPFAFDIAVAVRRDDERRQREIDALLTRLAPQVSRILDDFGVPRARAPDAGGTRS